MKEFLDHTFLLQSPTAERLFHEYAGQMPIIDYHCHLDPALIAADHRFDNITEAWLKGDHYKWRAMRANGIEEQFITGDSPDEEKFDKWAETVPYTIRNPLFHWTHLELRRYFGIEALLAPTTSREIFQTTSAALRTSNFSVRRMLEKMKVELVCTTDDP
ncbi:MAG: glucuronate isomerase, partial [Bacteroidales bacterium]|nr:glucuronate isomerase [Bacteroidales bacterium]